MAPITKAGAKKASARKQRRDKALPLSKSRKAYFDAAYAAVDTGDLLATVPALAKLLREHPEAAALMRVKQALQDLHLDPTVHHGSYELTRFVGLMRELITDAMPGMTLEQILEPLRTLLSQHGGGRPTKLEEFQAWLEQFEARDRANRTAKSHEEIYQDIAEVVNAARAKTGGKAIGWKQIRKGIGMARKHRRENPV